MFIHGLWLHATSWQPWMELFGDAGYTPLAPGWPGDPDTVEAARAHPDALADHGIDEVVAHYAGIISELPSPPILVGHSFGGMIAQKLLGQDLAVAAVAVDAAQIKGVLPLPLSALRATLPVFKNPANKHRSVSLTADQFRYAFGNAIPREESARWTIPAPGKTPVRGRGRDPQPTLPRQGRHWQPEPRAAAAGHRRARPHRPRGRHPRDGEAVPPLRRRHRPDRVPRPRPLPDHRQRVA